MVDKDVKKTIGVEKVNDRNLKEAEKKKMEREKRNAYMREYYQKNKEKILRRRRERYRKNKEAEIEQQKERYATDPEYRHRKIENAKRWREENREEYNAYMREYRRKRKQKNND